MRHTLKIRKTYMDAKLMGLKLFEIRDDSDRGFNVGDTVVYIDSETSEPYPQEYIITYITRFEQNYPYVVFGEKRID